MTRRMALSIAVLLSALAVGCQPDLERVEIRQDTQPPLEHSITPAAIKLTHGTAVAITVKGYNSDGEAEDGKVSLLAVSNALYIYEREQGDDGTQFVLIADTPGSGEALVYVEGTNGELTIPFTVLAQ